MPIFRKSRESTLPRELADAIANRDRIKQELNKVEETLSKKQAEAVGLAVAGEAAEKRERASAAVAAAKQQMATLVAARSQVEQHVAELEREQAVAEEAKRRKETDEKIAVIEAEIERDSSAYVAAALALAKSCSRAVPVVFEARGVELFAESSSQEVSVATTSIIDLLKAHARAVREGHVPATISEPEVAPLREPATPKPEITGLVAMKHVCWAESGNVRLAAKGWPVALPIALAEQAMATGSALPPGHPEAASLANSPRRSRDLPLLTDCIALDPTAEEAKQAAMKQSSIEEREAVHVVSDTKQRELAAHFERIDRGPALVGTAKFN
ncbi:PspA/IM30 family protein [Bradyrhizobium sp. USDA 4471]